MGSRVVPFIGHAVGNLGAKGEGIRIMTMLDDEHSVSSAGHRGGPDFFMGGVQLVLKLGPTGSGRCPKSDLVEVVWHSVVGNSLQSPHLSSFRWQEATVSGRGLRPGRLKQDLIMPEPVPVLTVVLPLGKFLILFPSTLLDISLRPLR